MDVDGGLSVQNTFFNQVRKDRTRVSVLLTNGQRVNGVIKSFDKFTFLLDTRQGDQMIFKHAVSAVSILASGDAAREGRGARSKARPREGHPGKPEDGKFGNFIRFDHAEGEEKG